VRLLSRSRRARSPVAAGQRAAAHARPGGRAQHRPLAIAMATLVPCRAGRRTSVAGVLPRAPGKGRRPAQARAVNSPTQLAHPFFLVRCRPAHVGLLWKPVGERASVRGSFTQGSPSAEAPQEVTAAAPQLATASFQSPPQGQAYSIRGDGHGVISVTAAGPSIVDSRGRPLDSRGRPNRRAHSMGVHSMGPAGWGGGYDGVDGYLEKFGGRGSGLVSVSGGSSALGIRSVASVGGLSEPEGGGRAGRGRGASRLLDSAAISVCDGPAAPVGITSLSSDAAPYHRAGCVHLRCCHQRVRRASSTSRHTISFERCGAMPSCRMCSPTVLPPARARGLQHQ